ncbi:MAG: site-specific integrase [Sulfurimicrobium sp.]|nr:site-specific integrase [Sulfurimicrobium sp.]
MKTTATFPALLESFFTERLMKQRRVSPETIASYRDTFSLFLNFAQKHLHRAPSTFGIEDVDVPIVCAFLDHLEKERGNCSRTRNARLAAIHSLFKYAALRDPAHSAVIQRVLAIPGKKYDRTTIDFLTRPEVEAILSVPDPAIWSGRRDKALLILAVQTGLRVSELIGLSCQDISLDSGPHVRCKGKGRKERCTPLRKETVTVLRAWIRELNRDPAYPLFPNARGQRLSRDGVDYLLRIHLKKARQKCPSLMNKRVSPHVLRHTAAMELLEHGVDRSVIALWLGHETLETVQIYVHASLQMKEKAMAKTSPLEMKPGRFQPGDELLAFLKSL